VVWHVVLLKPRAELCADRRRQFADAFQRAVTSIPSVRGVRFGRRVMLGAGYERNAPDTGEFLAVVEFDDRAGLAAYLAHPAHDALGVAFGESLSAALVYDFDIVAETSAELGAALAPLIENS
jgi:hypothetical protein